MNFIRLRLKVMSKSSMFQPKKHKKRLRIMSQTDEIVTKINREFGDSIASIFYKNEQDFKMVIRTIKKGNTQNQITKLAAEISKEYGLPIEVIANHPRNFKSVQNIITNQYSRISRQYPSLQMIGYNPEHDAISLAFYEPDATQRQNISTQFAKLSGMDTIIEFLDQPMTQTSLTDEVVGGGALAYSATNTSGCTAGFIGTMNGRNGFITATHCITSPPPTHYVNRFGTKYALGTPITDKSIYHEVSFVPVNNGKMLGEVYQYLSARGVNQTYRDNMKITGLGVVNTGNAYTAGDVGRLQLCHIGQTTGFSCGTVAAVNVGGGGCNATISGNDHRACASTFINVAGSSLQVQKGDSGGPFFDASGKAYGLASAGVGNSTTVTPIRYIAQAGFQLKLGS
ncbi:S1 family peptidase [Moraxella sp. FZLJ2107]|uniref:S1 family peptidase n=1 Tax=Moraxella sp. FZLJ2107 TaxID=2961618 RepID=UPI0020C83996|nr:S1 family peptidase [Moraxella sp. FZLJ2107]UTO05996.1 S1 family peptidase [Moraxella sp. FZLJ2107]